MVAEAAEASLDGCEGCVELVEDRKGFVGTAAFKIDWVSVLDERGGEFFVEFLGCFVWVHGFGKFELFEYGVYCFSEVVV